MGLQASGPQRQIHLWSWAKKWFDVGFEVLCCRAVYTPSVACSFLVACTISNDFVMFCIWVCSFSFSQSYGCRLIILSFVSGIEYGLARRVGFWRGGMYRGNLAIEHVLLPTLNLVRLLGQFVFFVSALP